MEVVEVVRRGQVLGLFPSCASILYIASSAHWEERLIIDGHIYPGRVGCAVGCPTFPCCCDGEMTVSWNLGLGALSSPVTHQSWAP